MNYERKEIRDTQILKNKENGLAGILNKYANPFLKKKEKIAWEISVKDKFKNSLNPKSK